MTWKKSTLILGFIALFSWLLLLLLITAGHPLELLKYNFVDVAKDQWWYFAPYSPSSRIFGIGQISNIFSRENDFPLAVLFIAIILAIKTKRIEYALLAWIGLILFAGGSPASIGGHLGGYFDAFYYWGAITAVLAFLRWFQLSVYKRNVPSEHESCLRDNWLVIPIFFILLVSASDKWSKHKGYISDVKKNLGIFFVPELGGYLGLEWKDYTNYIRQHNGSKVIEEYWGIWSALNKIFPLWPVDSVIHALGSVWILPN